MKTRESGMPDDAMWCKFFDPDAILTALRLTPAVRDAVDFAMLFNLLHAEQPLLLLAEAWRILGLGGRVAVIHWNNDPATPRGPSMAIRPQSEDCRRWLEDAGFAIEGGMVDLPPLSLRPHWPERNQPGNRARFLTPFDSEVFLPSL